MILGAGENAEPLDLSDISDKNLHSCQYICILVSIVSIGIKVHFVKNTVLKFLIKLSQHLPYDTANSYPGIYPS